MSRVVLEDRFGEFGAAFDTAVKEGILKTAGEARSLLAFTFPGTIGAAARVGPVEPLSEKGYRGSAYMADFRAVMLDKGTLGNRRGKLSARSARKDQWQVRRQTGTFTAHRRPEALEPGHGIEARGYTRQINQQLQQVFEKNLARAVSEVTE